MSFSCMTWNQLCFSAVFSDELDGKMHLKPYLYLETNTIPAEDLCQGLTATVSGNEMN